MKKSYLYKTLGFATILGIFASCTTEMLNVEPYGKSTTETYYSTDEEVQSALIGAYDFLSSDQFAGWSSTFFIDQLPADDSNAGGGNADDQPHYQALDNFNWSSENVGIENYFKIYYSGINRCNELIAKTEPNTDIKIRSIAEAKFLRAYFYFKLTVAFGDIPLWLNTPKSLTEGKAKSAQSEVWAQIEIDLIDAEAGLPNKNVYSGNDKFRANKQAAQALKGKAHVYQKEWTEAVTEFGKVIASEGTDVGFDTVTKYIERFQKGTEFGLESIFEASFLDEGKNWGNAGWDRSADDNRHIILSGPRDGAVDTFGIGAGWGFNPATQKIADAFNPIADKYRMEGTVLSNAELAAYGVSVTSTAWDQEGCLRMKYTTYASETKSTDGATPELNYGTNWRLIRYADVLLLDAEAKLNAGDAAGALVSINRVREQAKVAPLASVDMAAIKKERQLELAFEGSRFWDLVRWGDAATELSTLGFIAGRNEHFPIPLKELVNNSALDEIKDQNTGY